MSTGLLSRVFSANWDLKSCAERRTEAGLPVHRFATLRFILRTWFQQFGVEAFVYLPLVSWVAIRLKRGDQSAEARRENDQISGVVCGSVGVGGACRHKDCCSRSDGFRPVGVAKGELAIQDVPRLVIGMMDVERCRTAAAPFVDLK
jgi:hypothetical protein